jgi:hypothetical protein
MDRDSSGDYSYDLAHEEIGRATAGRKASGRATGPERDSASSTGSTDDRSGDLTYDEAHDF